MNIQGVIFDLDGLILDTEKLYQRFWREASKICGYNMTQEQALQLRSLDKNLAKDLLKDFFGKDYSYQKVKEIRTKLMAEYIEENGVQAKNGVAELVGYLKENGYKIAIATATNYERASYHLKLAGVRDLFDNIICACELEHGKPFPDVYLYACEKLGLAPENCVALEDSPNGIKSAYSAGCIPILVPDNEKEDESELKPFISASAKSLLDVVGIVESLQKTE